MFQNLCEWVIWTDRNRVVEKFEKWSCIHSCYSVFELMQTLSYLTFIAVRSEVFWRNRLFFVCSPFFSLLHRLASHSTHTTITISKSIVFYAMYEQNITFCILSMMWKHGSSTFSVNASARVFSLAIVRTVER